ATPPPAPPPPPPIIIGGGGPKRTPKLAATYASEYNTAFVSTERFTEQRGRVQEACKTIGRDPASLVYTAALVVCCGTDEAELARRAKGTGPPTQKLRPHRAAAPRTRSA